MGMHHSLAKQKKLANLEEFPCNQIPYPSEISVFNFPLQKLKASPCTVITTQVLSVSNKFFYERWLHVQSW
jgi:hypothetical protein